MKVSKMKIASKNAKQEISVVKRHTLQEHAITVKKGGYLPLVSDNGENVCITCGYVSPDKVEVFSTSRDKDENPISVSGDYRIGKNSIIGNRDALGKPLSSTASSHMQRLKREDGRSKISKYDRTLTVAASLMDKWSVQLGLNEAVVDATLTKFTKILKVGTIRGRRTRDIVAACAYVEGKKHGAKLLLTPFCDTVGVTEKSLFSAQRSILELFNENSQVASSKEFVSGVIIKLGLGGKIERECLNLIDYLEKVEYVAGKGRASIVAMAVYLSTRVNGSELTQKEIAVAAGVTEVTIRNRIKSLNQDLKVDLIKIMRTGTP